MTATYRAANEVAKIGTRLIREHHKPLDDVRVDFVFRSEAAKSNGQAVWGRCRKMTGLNAFVASRGDETEFLVVEIAEDVWKGLDEDQQAALVDHELSHATVDDDKDGNPKIRMRGHDLEEFQVIVERHGLWRPDIEDFAKAANAQLTFDDA